MAKYYGTIKQIYFTKGAWSSVRVLLDNGESINAAGAIVDPVIECPIKMDGKIEIHPTYGAQIKVTNSELDVDSSKSGMIAYLSSGLIKGVGDSLATRIVNHFGKNTFSIIEKTPDRLMEVKGIKEKKKESIIEALSSQILFRKLYELLGGRVTTNQAIKIIEEYKDDAIKVIKENPYQLIYDIDGFGFIKVDSIAKSSGIKEDSKERIGAAIVYVLRQLSNMEGHCYGTLNEIQERVVRVLLPEMKWAKKKYMKGLLIALEDDCELELFHEENPVAKENLPELDGWVKMYRMVVNKMADVLIDEENAGHIVIDGECIYWSKIYMSEEESAQIIVDMCNKHPVRTISPNEIEWAIKKVEDEEGYELEEEQKQSVSTCLRNRFSIITGGPGRGKTTIIKAILEAWGDDDSVVLCAPTGRASQKMREATGRKAGTIHRLVNNFLGYGQLVICDEASMLDINLAHRLLKNSSECNIILVGDVDQLEPIGPGSFFKDLVNSPLIPTVKLIKGHRNHGAIAKNASLINKGKRMKDYVFNNNFSFIPVEKEKIQEKVLDKYLELRSRYGERDICVLTPMRQRSRGGVNAINEIIRNKVNPYNSKNEKIKGCNFRIGDRIMQTKNMYKKEVLYNNGMRDVGVFNGDCGKIMNINSDENQLTIRFDDGRTAVYNKYETENLTLAYAMTVHKSQGSEYKTVIVIHNMEHYIMLRKNLLYTAITRAKQEVVLMGEEKAFSDAASNVAAKVFGEIKRNTNLRIRMLEKSRQVNVV